MPKGYPRSRFDIVDQTQVQEIITAVSRNPVAVVMIPYTSDKGSENWEMLYNLTDFTSRKGGINFTKHGLPQLLAAEILRVGGYVFGKRMVAKDATIANVTVKARVKDVGDEKYVYIYTSSATNVGSIENAANAGYDNFDPDTPPDADGVKDFPLFTITAKGRGASNMFVRIIPEYSTSRSSSYIRYSIEVWENQQLIENVRFCMNPDIVIDDISQSLAYKVSANSNQIDVKVFDDGIYALVNNLAQVATTGTGDSQRNINARALINLDFINGKDIHGDNIGGIVASVVDTDNPNEDPYITMAPDDIEYFYNMNGAQIPLSNGSYGSLGTAPWQNQTAYNVLLMEAFGKTKDADGQYDPVIYDLDYYKPTCIVDCMYSFDVKNAIIDLCEFRGDCVFLADLCGLYVEQDEGVDTYKMAMPADLSSIIVNAGRVHTSRYVAMYHNFFNMINPYTKKEITVSMPFLLAKRLVAYIGGGAGRPFAGIANDMYFPEIITGTINFTPVVTPDIDQKQELVNVNINYLNYYDGVPVMDTMYCNAEEYTQLTYLSNVLLIQEIIRAIRTRCPRTRYTFLDGTDLEEYIKDANTVINRYTSMFRSISIQYMADEAYESNNIFYATIVVQFRNFITEEYFRVIAIS